MTGRYQNSTAEFRLKVERIAAGLGLMKAQVNTWVKRGVADGQINKVFKPVRYVSASAERQQSSFDLKSEPK